MNLQVKKRLPVGIIRNMLSRPDRKTGAKNRGGLLVTEKNIAGITALQVVFAVTRF